MKKVVLTAKFNDRHGAEQFAGTVGGTVSESPRGGFIVRYRPAPPTAESLAAQAPAGWTATHGAGWAWSWDAEEDAADARRTRTAPTHTWVRFTRTDGAVDAGIPDLTVVIALNVSTPGSGKFDKWDRDRAWNGRTVNGHTMYNGRSFTRHGIDSSSCELLGATAHGYEHSYRTLDALLAGEFTRCRAAHDRSKTMIAVPGLPGDWKVTPTRRQALSLSLRGGGIAEFRPHGMGTGYVVSAKKPRRWGRALPAATAEFFGVTGPLFYETTDCD